MALTLYLLRHGQTTFSRDNVFCGSGLDPELTPDGIEMARQFAIAHAHIPWGAVYCSPLRRTMMTASHLCEAAGAALQVREELKEIAYGAWEGKSVAEVDRTYHDDHIRWLADPAWYPPTGGEPAVEIERRGLQVIGEITRTFSEGNVLAVSHKATIRIILCGLLGIDVGRFRYRLACPVASVSIVEFGPNGPLLKALADRTHLDQRLRSLPGS